MGRGSSGGGNNGGGRGRGRRRGLASGIPPGMSKPFQPSNHNTYMRIGGVQISNPN